MQSFLDYIWDTVTLLFSKALILRIPIGYGSQYISLANALLFAMIFGILMYATRKLMRS